jgi:hypothetical protein
MEDKRSIQKVMESQGDVHAKVTNQSNSEPYKIGVVRNYQNSTDLQNRFWCCATILARWAVYLVGVH